MKIKTELINLNHVNGADELLFDYTSQLLTEFPDEHLYGCEMGIAYGGGVEGIASMWGERGSVWGFDVFEELHPKHLADDPTSFDATCMDYWYGSPDYGKERLALEYQQKIIDGLGLKNLTLVKGEVNKDSCEDIPKLHYAFLDMDIPFSMKQGYSAVRDKIVKGGYLFLHDTQNIPGVGDWMREEVTGRDTKMWEQVGEWGYAMLIGFRRK